MIKKLTLLIFVFVGLSHFVFASEPIESLKMSSPSNNNATDPVLTLETSGELSYSLQYNGMQLLKNSPLSISIVNSPELSKNLEIISVSEAVIDETWEPVLKAHAQIRNFCNEYTVAIREKNFPGRTFTMIFRVYNNGIAFRYYFSKEFMNEKSIQVEEENTTFNLIGDPKCWAADYKDYYSHQEAEFMPYSFDKLPQSALFGLPMVAKFDNKTYMAITEAQIDDYAGMYLKKLADGTLTSDLSKPRKVVGKGRVNMILPHYTPWRVIMLGDHPGRLIENEMVMNLNKPCAIDDVSWIKPGLCAWDNWWSGDVKMDTETIKKYIDLASENKFPYMLIDWQWYGAYNKPDADVMSVTPKVDMELVRNYAKQKNVKLWLWLYWTDISRKMEEAFALYESWGIAGIKIDFMSADDQEMVNWYANTVKLAAKHKLMINFHGAYKPDGFRRTYPNLMTREGVLGNEYNKWSYRATPEHNVTIPFTRMLAGPMDYTPGGFLNAVKGQFSSKTPTMTMGTRCHELAKFVVFYSPITTVCDHPNNYKNQIGTDFLQLVPTTWDDTKVLAGEIGEYIVMAHRKGDNWFIAAMTNSNAREVNVDLSFLSNNYQITTWSDGPQAETKATDAVKTDFLVDSKSSLKIKMASGGGFVGFLKKK